MVSIMATILVLSSSGKEFNSCGSIFFLSESICFVLVGCQNEDQQRKGSPFSFFFFAPSSFFLLFIFIHSREKKNIDRGPVTHTCFHFPRWTLINIIITIVLKATSRRRIRRRWRSWRRNYWTVFSSFSLSPRIFIFVQQQNDKTDRESLSSSLCFFRRAEREHAQSLTRGVFAVNAYRERLASRRGGVGDERAAPAPATGSATRTKENDFSQRKGGGGTRRFEEKDEEKEKKERTREGRR
jgi:hypothetical protein